MLAEHIWELAAVILLLVMLFGNKKVRVFQVFVEQLRVFKNDRKHKTSPWDIICFIVMPIGLATIITYKFEITMDVTLAGIFTTVFSLVFTVLFGFAAILVGKIGSGNSIEQQVVGETFVSILSATLLSLFSVILSIAALTASDEVLCILSTAVFSAAFMVVMLMLMITKRTYTIYSNSSEDRGK